MMIVSLKNLPRRLLAQQQALMFFGFMLGFFLLNLGMYQRLEPSIKTFVKFPYIFKGELKGWESKSGTWQIEDGGLSQTQDKEGLIGSPLFLNETGLKLSLELEPGSGISFFGQNRGQLEQSQVVYILPQGTGLSIVAGTIDENGVLSTQAKNSYSASSKVLLSIETGSTSYRVFINNDLLFDNLPLSYTQGWLSLSSTQKTHFDGLLIDKTVVASSEPALAQASLPEKTNLLYSNDFSLPLEREWRILSGNWQVEEGKLWQYISEGFDYTVLYPQVFSKYQVSTNFEQTDNLGAGILFNLPSFDSYAGGQLVRLTHSDTEEGIFWGFYDMDGQFIGQGYLKLELDKARPHNLKLEVKETTYSIYLDGELLRDGLALKTPEGYLGLTVSESIVAFDDLQVQPLEE